MTTRALLVYLLLGAAVSTAASGRASPDDGLLDLLAGEFSLQQGDAAEASARFLRAAGKSRDPRVAERATQVAMLAGERSRARKSLQRWRELSPDDPGLRAADVRLALLDGEAAAAYSALAALLDRGDGWRPALQSLASSEGKALAPELLARLVAEQRLPADFEAWLAFGGLAQRLERADIGRNLASAAVLRFPAEARAWLWLAEEAQRAGETDAARSAIARAVALGPLDSATRLALAARLDALGDAAAAAAALAEGEQDDSTLAGRAAYLARAEDTAALAELYALAAAEPGTASPARLFLLGQISELMEAPQQALDWYERVPAGLQREQSQLRIAVLLDQLERHEEAIARLREVQASDSEYGEILRDAYLLEAELLQRRGRSEDAIDAYARGLQIFEDDPELIYARALGYERVDRLSEAEADLRRLIEMDPENPDALNALGYTLTDRTDRHEEALALIEQALALNPDSPAIIDSMGWVLFRLGRASEALPYLERAYALQPDPDIAAHLGEVLWSLGREDEARAAWTAGRKLDPDNRALRGVRERFGE